MPDHNTNQDNTEEESVSSLNSNQYNIATILKKIKMPERRSVDSQPEKVIELKPITTDDIQPAEEQPISEVKIETSIAALHTLKDDLQGVVRGHQMSVVRMASLEEVKRHGAVEHDTAITNQVRPKGSMRGIIFALCILFGLGCAALLGVYLIATQQSTQNTTDNTNSIIFSEKTVTLPLDSFAPNVLKQEILQARNTTSASVGSIVRIIPTLKTSSDKQDVSTRAATLSEFLNALDAHVPSDLLRALGDNFFFGLHVSDKVAPVFVIPVTSYSHAFAGMLTWEQLLNSDLVPIFKNVPVLITDSQGLKTTRVFQDAVISNYDVRTLKDDDNIVQLYYTFPKPDILIIAEDPYTFTEVLSRLRSARKL